MQPAPRYPAHPTGAQRKLGKSHAPVLGSHHSRAGTAPCAAGSFPYLCVLPDGEFLTLGLLECIDRNPELTVSHAGRWALVKFLWGLCHQRQL